MSGRVTIAIPTFDGRALLERTLPSAIAQGAEVVVVDDGSSDGSTEWLAERWPEVRVIALPANEGVARVFNHAVRAASTPYVALVNNDVELADSWAGQLADELDAHPEAAAVSGKLMRFDDRTRIDAAGDGILWSTVVLNRGHLERDRGQWDEGGEVVAACAGAALYRRAAFDSVGEFDESLHAYLEDVDWALRARLAGWTIRYAPAAVGFHMGSATTRHEPGRYARLQRRNQVLVALKDFPAQALIRHAPEIALHHLLWLAASARAGLLGTHLRAWGEIVVRLPATLRARRTIQRGRHVGYRELDPLVRRTLPAGIGRTGRVAFALAPEVARRRRLARLG